MEIEEFFYTNLRLKDRLNIEFTAWYQRKRWHHLLYLTHIA